MRRPTAVLRWIRRYVLYTLAAAAIAGRAGAQSPMGSVEGTVMDSLRHRYLDGATVIATPLGAQRDSTFHATVTDDGGRFQIKDLPFGRYAISVEHPVIDSTGIGVPTAEVEVTGARSTTVALAIPSAVRLRRTLCPATQSDSLTGVVLGVVRRTDDSPVPSATVVFVWGDFDVDSATAVATPKQLTAHVTTDSQGVFRACGLPLTSPLSIQAQAETNEQSGVLEEEIGVSGVRVINLHVGRALPEPVAAATTNSPADSANAPADTTNSLSRHLITGRVQDVSGRAVSSAHVRLFGTTLEAMTNETGAFRLAGLPSGTQGLEVVALSYAPRRVTVDVAANSSPITVTMERASVVLDSILVTAKRLRPRTRTQRDFDERARRGHNYYFTPADIERWRPFYATDLLYRVPGVHIVRRGFDVFISSGRGSATPQFRGGQCPMAIYLDGINVRPEDIADLPPQRLYGVEVVLSSIGSPPGHFVGTCGAIFVWTK
ncbi:MAG TPA: carboxypeptidase regulatory-like domain-containing protein [Gemmatimonadaceae bacterium]